MVISAAYIIVASRVSILFSRVHSFFNDRQHSCMKKVRIIARTHIYMKMHMHMSYV